MMKGKWCKKEKKKKGQDLNQERSKEKNLIDQYSILQRVINLEIYITEKQKNNIRNMICKQYQMKQHYGLNVITWRIYCKFTRKLLSLGEFIVSLRES